MAIIQDFSNYSKETVASLESVISSLDSAYSKAQALNDEMASMEWSGQHYEHVKALLELILQYHNGLINVSIDIRKAVNDFEGYFNRYSDLESYISIEKIDGK